MLNFIRQTLEKENRAEIEWNYIRLKTDFEKVYYQKQSSEKNLTTDDLIPGNGTIEDVIDSTNQNLKNSLCNSPCLNGGICVNDVCICKENYEGITCENQKRNTFRFLMKNKKKKVILLFILNQYIF